MSAIRNLPISRKLVIAFGIVCLLCLSLGTYTFFTFWSINKSSVDVSETTFPAFVALTDARGALNQIRLADIAMLLCQSSSCSAAEEQERQQALEDYETALKVHEPTITYPGEREVYEKCSAPFGRYKELRDRGKTLDTSSKAGDKLNILASPSMIAMAETVSSINDDLQINMRIGLASSRQTSIASSRAEWIVCAATFLIIARFPRRSGVSRRRLGTLSKSCRRAV